MKLKKKMQLRYNIVTKSDLPLVRPCVYFWRIMTRAWKTLRPQWQLLSNPLYPSVQQRSFAALCLCWRSPGPPPALRAELMTALHAVLGPLMETKFKRETFSSGITTLHTTGDFILETCTIHVLYLLCRTQQAVTRLSSGFLAVGSLFNCQC